MSNHIFTRLYKKVVFKSYAFCLDNISHNTSRTFSSRIVELPSSSHLRSYKNCKIHIKFGRNLACVCHINKFQFSSNMASPSEEFRHLDYKQLIDFRNKEKHILIDVREKSEIDETGVIPGAYHIPVGEIDTALGMSDDVFKATYKFNKPSQEDQIVFSCRSGKRSLMALEKAISQGFVKARHYKGGWLDWEKYSTPQ